MRLALPEAAEAGPKTSDWALTVPASARTQPSVAFTRWSENGVTLLCQKGR